MTRTIYYSYVSKRKNKKVRIKRSTTIKILIFFSSLCFILSFIYVIPQTYTLVTEEERLLYTDMANNLLKNGLSDYIVKEISYESTYENISYRSSNGNNTLNILPKDGLKNYINDFKKISLKLLEPNCTVIVSNSSISFYPAKYGSTITVNFENSDFSIAKKPGRNILGIFLISLIPALVPLMWCCIIFLVLNVQTEIDEEAKVTN